MRGWIVSTYKYTTYMCILANIIASNYLQLFYSFQPTKLLLAAWGLLTQCLRGQQR